MVHSYLVTNGVPDWLPAGCLVRRPLRLGRPEAPPCSLTHSLVVPLVLRVWAQDSGTPLEVLCAVLTVLVLVPLQVGRAVLRIDQEVVYGQDHRVRGIGPLEHGKSCEGCASWVKASPAV